MLRYTHAKDGGINMFAFIGILILLAYIGYTFPFESFKNTILILIAAPLIIFIIIKIIKYTNDKKKRDQETFDKQEREARVPTCIRPISGSFACSFCGAKKVMENDIHPDAICPYCGARIIDLSVIITKREEELIEERNRVIAENRREETRLKDERIQEMNHRSIILKNIGVGIMMGGIVIMFIIMYLSMSR